MIIYWIALIITCVISSIRFSNYALATQNVDLKMKHSNVFLCFIPLFLVALFRWNVGVDVVYGSGYYYNEYTAIQHGLGNIYNYEIGFYGLMELCNFFHLNLYLFYCTVTFIFFYLFTKFIADNTKNVTLAAIIFVLSDLYLFTFSTLRQSLAIAFSLYPIFCIINGEKYLKNCKWWVSFLLSLSMHNSILYLYLMIFLSKIKLKKEHLLLLVTFLCILSPFLQKVIMMLINSSYYFRKYIGTNMEVSDFSITYFGISAILFLLSLLNYKNMKENNVGNYRLINIAAFTTIIMAYSKVLIMPYRIFPLFIPIYIVLISRIINTFKPKTYNRLFTLVYMVLPFLLLFVNQYYISGGNEFFEYHSIFEFLGQVWP